MGYPDGAKLDLPGGPHEPEPTREERLRSVHAEEEERAGRLLTQAERALGRLGNDVSQAGILKLSLLSAFVEQALEAIEAPELGIVAGDLRAAGVVR